MDHPTYDRGMQSLEEVEPLDTIQAEGGEEEAKEEDALVAAAHHEDRTLRHRLQMPGASIPPWQMPRPPHSQVVCESIRVEATTDGQPLLWVAQVSYWFVTRLPAREIPPKVPLRLDVREMIGWRGHPCKNRLCHRRCLRPVFGHTDNRHNSHWCDGCYRG